MGYGITADSLIADSVKRDRLLEIVSPEFTSPVISGDIPHRALEHIALGNQVVPANHPMWYFMLMFLLIASIAVSQLFFGQLLKGTFQAAVRYSFTVGLYNDNSQLQRQKDNILYAIYFVSLSFFIMLIEIRYAVFPFQLKGFFLFLWNMAFLTAIFYLKILFVNLIAYIFNQTKLYREYLYHSFTLNKLFGLLLAPLVFLLAYSRNSFHEVCFYIVVALFVAMIMMKIIKGIVFSIKKRVFSFYLFLYLCALEIVPILLIYKLITSIV